MFEELKKQVYDAAVSLTHKGLTVFGPGSVSGIDRDKGIIVTAPLGVDYRGLSPENMVAVNLSGGQPENFLPPVRDFPAHIELYKRFAGIGGIVHTYSQWATVWAQALRPIPPYGTAHCSCFYGEIPVTRALRGAEIKKDYELNIGRVIAETFELSGISPKEMPAVLVGAHAPVCWGKTAAEAVEAAAALETAAMLAWHTESIAKSGFKPLQKGIWERYYKKNIF